MAILSAPLMKRSSTAFLQIVIVLIGIGALALVLWEPHIEGRNAHATVFEIYFKDRAIVKSCGWKLSGGGFLGFDSVDEQGSLNHVG